MLLADFRYIFFVLDLLDKLRSCWDVEKLNLNSECLNISKKQMSKYTIDPSSHHISPSIKHPLPWQLSLSLLPKYKVDVTQHHFCYKGKRTGGGPCLLSVVESTGKGFLAHRLQQEEERLQWEHKLLYFSYWPQRQLWMPSSDLLRFSSI